MAGWIKDLSSLWRKTTRALKLRIRTSVYQPYLKLLVRRVSRRRPIKVMFYVNNLSMWKSDKLLMLLKKDKVFEPFIVSYLYPSDSPSTKKEREESIFSHFHAMGIKVLSGFDYKTNSLIPVNSLNPDIVFYPQPYKKYRLREMPRNYLLSYIPYCFEMEVEEHFYNSSYQNICWKLFVPSKLHKELKTKYNYNHGANVVVAGNPLADYFFDGHTPSDEAWPVKDSGLKRIIWAPHHSIQSQDWLDYSNFLEIADVMLEIAKEYKDRVQFVFKPHPMLKEKLYKNDSWGPEKTDQYYETWATMPNTRFADGNYVDLFMTSDALIHDCSSFTAEYLYVNKPVMYLTRKDKIDYFNAFADACFQVHYHGCSKSEITSFIEDVIKGVDPLKEKRTLFIREQIIPRNRESVAETMYHELCSIYAE